MTLIFQLSSDLVSILVEYCVSLTHLNLASNPCVDDVTLCQLATCRSLSSLNIANCDRVTDGFVTFRWKFTFVLFLLAFLLFVRFLTSHEGSCKPLNEPNLSNLLVFLLTATNWLMSIGLRVWSNSFAVVWRCWLVSAPWRSWTRATCWTWDWGPSRISFPSALRPFTLFI